MAKSNEPSDEIRIPRQKPPVIESDPFDMNDVLNYIREPGEMPHHIRDPIPSEIAYRS
ncbi:MAG: hypothetical protein RLZZ227_2778 [Pseudomonadota bacterium]|jgi:hypothetical protein